MGTVTDRKRSHASCYFAPRAPVGGGGGSEMKARPMDTAGGTPGPAGRSGPASFSGPSSRTKAGEAVGAGAFVSGALGAALLAAAALLLHLFAPGDARAVSECGSALTLPITCTDTSYPDGIFYGGVDDNQPRGNGPINIAGSSTATTTITSTSRTVISGGTTTTSPSVGLYVYGHQGSFQWNDVNVGVTVDSMGEMTDAGHVVNIVQGTSTNNAADRNNGIYFQHRNQMGDSTVRVGRGVTIGSETTPMRQNGIFYHPRGTSTWGAAKATLISAATIFAAKQGIRITRDPSNVYHPTYRRISDTSITNSGAIRSGEEGIYLYFARPAGGAVHLGDATITNTGAITVTGARYGIFMDYRGYGDTEIDNAGTIAAATGSGIHLAHNNNGAVTLTNSGDVDAATVGLRLGKYNGAGTVTITNSGGVTVRAAAAAGVGHALWLWEGGLATGGPATITNSGVLSSKNHALFAQMSAANAAALTLTNSGAVASANGDGIRIERGVEGDVTFANGGTSATSGNVSGKGHGIYIGKAARIDFDQTAGRISGRTGVYAEVSRSLTTGGTRSTTSGGDHDPAIDIDWTGGTIARGTATNDNDRFAAASAAQVLAFDQESATVKAVAGSARWGSAAGIEAHALSWRDVVAQVAKGDDPGEISAGAGGLIISGGTTTTAVPASATASNAYIAQFKAALSNMDLDVASAVLTAIGTTATTAVADLTDAQIRTYLRTNNGATRTLLRNVLAQGLSDKEKAVLRAVAAGDSTALTTALDDTAAAFSSAYKTAVRALLDRYNLDDVRVSVSGGSIDSHGDGIRAYYATGHDNNGGIDVTIAAGATVSGGVNGILVSGSGTTSTGTKNQDVTVAGTVMGGTGAGVHLIGGGEVTVNAGGVVGATSGTAISTSGGGDLTANINGQGRVEGDIRAAGALTLTAAANSEITGTVHDPVGALTVAGSIGRLLYTNGGTVTVASTGALTGVSGQTTAIQSNAGALDVTVAGTVTGDIQATGTGAALMFRSQAGSRVTGTVHNPTGSLSVAGSIGRLLYTAGGTVTVASGGHLTGVSGETAAIQSSAGALDVTVAGTVTGDIQATGTGAALMFTSQAGSRVTGTVHDPTGSLSVAGSIGRLLYTNGGTVSVASTGALTGVSGETAAIQSSAGALDVTVNSGGTVTGDIQATGTGAALMFTSQAGSRVTGTVHDPTGSLSVAGSIGRLLYTNGGTVSVASTGALTGVEGEGIISRAGDLSVTVAGGSTVGGNILADGGGDLTAAIAGTVDGDIQADGALTFSAEAGSVITGTVYDPVGPLMVVGTIGRLLYTNGAVVTVAAGGHLTGVPVEGGRQALISQAGDLSVLVAGGSTVGGDISAGEGELMLTAEAESVITGTVHDPVGPLTVVGSIGRLLYTNGAVVTVAAGGHLTGVPVEGGRQALRSDAGNLSVTVAAGTTVQGDIRGLGDGDLTANISGWVDGDVVGSGGGEHVVTVPDGGTVTGTVHLDGSTVTVHGTVGRSIILAKSGTVTVGPGGTVGNGEAPGDYGVQIVGMGEIVTHGTIVGKNGISVGPGSTVTAGGMVRSTDGAVAGEAFRFRGGKDALDSLTFLRGARWVGGIYGLSGADPIDPRKLDEADRMANVFAFFDEEGKELDPDSLNILGRERDMVCTRKVCGKPDTTTFALTDDMLSDLTGSIHGAVMDTETVLRRGDPAAGRVVWAAPFGGARDQNGRGDVANATHYFGGGMLGMSWGAKDVRVGGFIGGSVGQLAGGKYQGNQTTDVDVQTLFFGLAASRALGPVLYDARLLVGSLTHDSTRSIPGVDTAEGNYSSVFFSPEVGVATTLTLTDTLEARPRLRVRYAGLFTEGFQESGPMTGWDMQFAERTLHVVEARAEVGIPFALADGGWINPRVGVEGRYLLSGSEIGVMDSGKMVSYDAGGDDGVITGTAGFGMTLPVAEATTLVGNFDGALTTEEAWRATGYLGLTWSF